MTVRSIITTIVAFFRNMFRAPAVPALAGPAPVESQVMKKPVRSARAIRRAALRLMLGRIDGGGKHYGSKRALCNHRGSGRGKRSGRA